MEFFQPPNSQHLSTPADPSTIVTLPSGHQSSSNITNGSVTSIGLLIKPSAKNNRAKMRVN